MNSPLSATGGVRGSSHQDLLEGPHFKVNPARWTPSRPLLECKGLCKSYRKANVEIPVLRGVDFQIAAGEFQAIAGQSGSGKSTLLHILATLDQPDAGQIYFAGERIDRLGAKRRDTLRNQSFGMIFQFYHLLPELTTVENVLLPSMIASSLWRYWGQRRSYRRRALELLELVGLGHRLKHRPQELSGGEMQRVAIARSLMLQPKILLADEPTGNLDSKTGSGIMEILRNLNKQQGLTIVMVTHDRNIAEQADGTMQMVEGRVETTKQVKRAS